MARPISQSRSWQAWVIAASIGVVTACGPSGAVEVTLGALAADHDAYDRRSVETVGVVVQVQDGPEDEPYYVLQDDSGNRVRLVPTASARRHSNQAVSVIGQFRFVPGRGRELRTERIAAVP